MFCPHFLIELCLGGDNRKIKNIRIGLNHSLLSYNQRIIHLLALSEEIYFIEAKCCRYRKSSPRSKGTDINTYPLCI